MNKHDFLNALAPRLLFVAALSLAANSSQSAPIQWSMADGGNDHWYEAFSVEGGITWTDAKAAAEAIGPGWHLVTITSAEENDFVFSLVSGQPQYWYCCTGPHASGPWLGAQRISVGGPFAWITGEPFVYTNWAQLEPAGNGDNIAFFGPGNTQTSTWNDIGPNRLDVISYVAEFSTVPVPTAAWLFSSGLLGLISIARHRKRA